MLSDLRRNLIDDTDSAGLISCGRSFKDLTANALSHLVFSQASATVKKTSVWGSLDVRDIANIFPSVNSGQLPYFLIIFMIYIIFLDVAQYIYFTCYIHDSCAHF